MMRPQRRILEGAAVAALASGAPSMVHALVARRSPAGAVRDGLRATRAVGTLTLGPRPARPGLARGAVLHGVISLAVAEGLGAALPRERSVAWGAAAGFGVGVVNLGVVARRRFPALAALPLGPQLADNAAFGALFAVVADRA
jgi:hypothetical protein